MKSVGFRTESISACDKFLIIIRSICIGIWAFCKYFFKKIFCANSVITLPRNKQPACLVDSSFGQHKYVKIQGTKFHYVDSGQQDLPVILLLHGFPDCWISWRYQIPVLSTHFRVIALDLKGFGDSEKPIWRRSYQLKRILQELKKFVNALGVLECSIIGHDLGALLGWFLVHDSPELVNKFVAVSCPHPNVYWKTLTSHNIFNSNWVDFVQLPFFPEIVALSDDLKVLTIAHKHLYQRGVKDEYLEAYKYSFCRQEDWTGPMNYYRNLPYIRVCETSEQVKVKTLLVQGDKNYNINLEGVIRSTEYCEKFLLRVIKGAGHFPHQENPDLFNREILKFLQVEKNCNKVLDKPLHKSFMGRFIGAGSSIVKYGNSVLVNVQNKTKSGVLSNISTIGINKDSFSISNPD